jgi:hypothetical protein
LRLLLHFLLKVVHLRGLKDRLPPPTHPHNRPLFFLHDLKVCQAREIWRKPPGEINKQFFLPMSWLAFGQGDPMVLWKNRTTWSPNYFCRN